MFVSNAGNLIDAEMKKPSDQLEFAIDDGDCGIVIKKDGQIRIFQVGIDTSELTKPVDNLTEEQKQVLKNGELLLVLLAVASNPEIQKVFTNAAYQNGDVRYDAANQS